MICAVCRSDGREFRFSVSRHRTLQALVHSLAAKVGVLACEFHLSFDGRRVNAAYDTYVSLGIEDQDTVDAWQEQRGGKPVIYLTPPEGQAIDATVSLRLSSAWSLSAIYPIGSSKRYSATRQDVSWSVIAEADGTLHDKGTNSDVAYLFWEAEYARCRALGL